MFLQPPGRIFWVCATKRSQSWHWSRCRSRCRSPVSVQSIPRGAELPGRARPGHPSRKSAFDGLLRGRGRVFLSRRNADRDGSALSSRQVAGSSGAAARALILPWARRGPGGCRCQTPRPAPRAGLAQISLFPFHPGRALLPDGRERGSRGGPGHDEKQLGDGAHERLAPSLPGAVRSSAGRGIHRSQWEMHTVQVGGGAHPRGPLPGPRPPPRRLPLRPAWEGAEAGGLCSAFTSRNL